MMYYIIKDLESASSLLSTVDPVITDGPRNYDPGMIPVICIIDNTG
ncbi:MAG: hypothetical protein V8R91_03980 [Butyricimonas faecihominis]